VSTLTISIIIIIKKKVLHHRCGFSHIKLLVSQNHLLWIIQFNLMIQWCFVSFIKAIDIQCRNKHQKSTNFSI